MYHLKLLEERVGFWLTHLNIQWMNNSGILTWCLVTAIVGCLIAWYNLSMLEGARRFWGDSIVFNRFSPRNRRQRITLWALWIALFEVLIISHGGPNLTTAPKTVPAGSTQVMFDYDGSNSSAAQPGRQYFAAMSGEKDPGQQFQWGTNLDIEKFYTKELLPQLAKNEAGLETIVGAGFNTWDLTRDLSEDGALYYMLDNWVVVGGATGGGCDYASGLQADLDEFNKITELDKQAGDTAEKERFIVLFTDGGFTGDEKALDAVLDEINHENEINQAKLHLLLVEVGGAKPTSVKKYDEETNIVTKESFAGTTFAEPVTAVPGQGEVYPGYPVKGRMKTGEKTLLHILARVKYADLIYAPPGTMNIHYSFPQKLGGIYAQAGESNLRPVFYVIAILIYIAISTGGGGKPQLRLIFLPIRLSQITGAVVSTRNWFKRNRSK
jgi:hypothetical protein